MADKKNSHPRTNKTVPKLDPNDRAILNEIQSNFPIKIRPYREVGQRLNLAEKEVISRVRRMVERGFIRRIGANFNSRKLGFTSTLCAARVPKRKLPGFIRVVNQYAGVTHNYEREGDYNIWFTFIAESQEKIETALKEIIKKTGIAEVINLPAEHIFKIQVDFEV
ncbi:MAG: AsnC family transcriptional regulator [Thermodesulfobacteriota bacterium]